MLVETGVFGRDRGIHQRLGKILPRDERAVFEVEGIEYLAVLRVQQGGQVALGILQLTERGKIGKNGHTRQPDQDRAKSAEYYCPKPPDYFFLLVGIHFRRVFLTSLKSGTSGKIRNKNLDY